MAVLHKALQNRLNNELKKGNSIAWWAKGYYVTVGNVHSESLKVPIFDFIESDRTPDVYQVLIDYLGEMMWINVRKEQVHYGYAGDNSPSKEGKDIRARLENLKLHNHE